MICQEQFQSLDRNGHILTTKTNPEVIPGIVIQSSREQEHPRLFDESLAENLNIFT